MKKTLCLGSITLFLCLICPLPSYCGGMSSTSYRVNVSVFSGGGEPIGSTSYALMSTAGQPSPIALSYSETHLLHSGFWHPSTLERPKVLLPWLPLLLLSE